MSSTYFLKDGTALPYKVYGNGRPVIFIPGWGGSKEQYWDNILPLIGGTKYRAIAVDQRGQGGTSPSNTRPITLDLMVQDIHDFIEGNDYSDVTLVGSSQGGQIINRYLSMYRDDPRIRSVVVVDVGPRIPCDENDPSYQCAQYRPDKTMAECLQDVEAFRTDFNTQFRNFILAIVPALNDLAEEERENAIREYFISIQPEELIEAYLSDLYADNRDNLKYIKVPYGYFYAGNEDAAFPASLAEYYKEHVAGAFEAVCFNDSDHLFFFHKYKEFAHELFKFLEKY